MITLLTRKDLRNLLSVEESIAVLEEGFRRFQEDFFETPVRMSVRIDNAGGAFLLMPAYSAKFQVFGTKLVSVFPKNRHIGKETINSIYMLNDPYTGETLALMDGVFLTGIRTGAASALATKYLSREDSRVLGVIGVGSQAPYQIEAISAVRPIEEVLLYDIDPQRSRRFVSEVSDVISPSIEIASSPSELVRKSDIVLTVTTSPVPVFNGNDLRLGTHINAVGSFSPSNRELDDSTVLNSVVVVDTFEGCLSEAGDLLHLIEKGTFSEKDIHADLAQLVTGKKSGRRNRDEITLFKSVGYALEDLVTAGFAYHKAKDQGIGTPLDFACAMCAGRNGDVK